MKRLILLFIMGINVGCVNLGYHTVAIQNQYPKSASATTSKTFEQAWSRAIDIMAETGMQVKILDKSSGIIVSEPYKLTSTFEDINHGNQLANANADVVCLKEYVGNNYLGYSVNATGNFNIRIKTENNQTSITVNLTNIVSSRTTAQYTVNQQNIPIDCVSTGVLERNILKMIEK